MVVLSAWGQARVDLLNGELTLLELLETPLLDLLDHGHVYVTRLG